jgi:hypothetical protein
MQIFKSTENRQVNAFVTKLEDIPGGGVVAAADLTQPEVLDGTPVGVDSNGLFHVVKTAKLTADVTNDATAYPVAKGHNFKVGDVIALKKGAKASAITAINTSEETHDTLTVGATLGEVAATGAVIFQAAAATTGTDSAMKYAPVGLVGTGFSVIPGDNHTTDIVVRGTVKEAVIAPIHADIKAALSLIRFV